MFGHQASARLYRDGLWPRLGIRRAVAAFPNMIRRRLTRDLQYGCLVRDTTAQYCGEGKEKRRGCQFLT